MKVQELIDSLGITRAQLAKIAGVSPSMITRMKDDVEQWVIDEVDAYRLKGALAEHIPVPEIVEDVAEWGDRVKLSHNDIARLCSDRREATDYMVAASVGRKVYEFRALIDKAVAYCSEKGLSFKELRA